MDHAKWKSMKKCARKWCRKLSIGPLERCGPLWWLSIWLSTFYLIFQATCCPGGQNCCPFGFVCTVNDDGSYGCGISPQSTTEKPWSSKSTSRKIVEISSQYKVVTLASIDIKNGSWTTLYQIQEASADTACNGLVKTHWKNICMCDKIY